MTQKKAQPAKKTAAKKNTASKKTAKKTSTKKAAPKKASAKKPGRPAKVKVEENVIKIDDIVEIEIAPEMVEQILAQKDTWIKKILGFLKK